MTSICAIDYMKLRSRRVLRPRVRSHDREVARGTARFGELLRRRRRGARRDARRQRVDLAGAAGGAAVPFFADGAEGDRETAREPNRTKIAAAMTVDNLSPGSIPAGFTYLGQFLDHDLTFDKSALMEGVDISPATLCSRVPRASTSTRCTATARRIRLGQVLQGRRLAPEDGRRAGWSARLRPAAKSPNGARRSSPIRETTRTSRSRRLMRHSSGSTTASSTRCRGGPAAQRFTEARKIVTKHYQWMVRTDYLPRICAPAVVTNVFSQGRKAFEVVQRRPASRRCRSSSRSRHSGSATA